MKQQALVVVKEKTIVFNLAKSKEYSEEYANSNGLVFTIKKRVFHEKIGDFAKSINDAVHSVPGLLDFLIQMNEAITDKEIVDKIEVVDTIFENINDEDFVNYITDKVNASYTIDIEEMGADVVRTNPNQTTLQFTNAYAKRIISVAIACRIILPLLCQYLAVHDIKKDDNFFLEMIGRIILLFNFDDEGNPIDLASKIQKFCQVQVDNTLYSDRVIWKYLGNLSINNHTLAREINRDLFTNIIPKLEENRSIVSFFHVVIKRKIEYQFTSKFKLSYKPISAINTNEEINPFIKVEQRLLKSTSEISMVLIKADIRNFVREHSTLTNDELNYHLNNIPIHTAQTKILGFFLNKHLGKGIPVMALSKKEYIQILFIAKEWFEQNGYRYISFILLGSPEEKEKSRRNLARGKSLLEITESEVYKSIIQKYTDIGESKVNSDTIISFIGEIINTNFKFYTLPDGTLYEIEAVPNAKVVIVELLSFIDSL